MIIGAGAGLWATAGASSSGVMAAAEGASCGGFVVLAAMQTIVVDVAAGENFQLDPESRAGRALKPPANGRPTITAAVQPVSTVVPGSSFTLVASPKDVMSFASNRVAPRPDNRK